METSGGGIMNEGIKELAEKAGFIFWKDEEWKPPNATIDWSCYYDNELEKFAELIVRECSRMADGWVDNDDNGKNYPSEMIKKHFGMEKKELDF